MRTTTEEIGDGVSWLVAAWQYITSHWGDYSSALLLHLWYVVRALAAGTVISVPLGILAARSRLVSFAAINFFSTIRAIPSLAILFLAYPFLGLGEGPALVALIVLACPPILINTAAGFSNLDPAVLEAARGMGMSGWQALRRVELPLALPVVLAGFRTSTLEVIASTTLAPYIGGGGLGDQITQGLGNPTPGQPNGILIAGAATVALIALCAEALLSRLQRILSPAA